MISSWGGKEFPLDNCSGFLHRGSLAGNGLPVRTTAWLFSRPPAPATEQFTGLSSSGEPLTRET